MLGVPLSDLDAYVRIAGTKGYFRMIPKAQEWAISELKRRADKMARKRCGLSENEHSSLLLRLPIIARMLDSEPSRRPLSSDLWEYFSPLYYFTPTETVCRTCYAPRAGPQLPASIAKVIESIPDPSETMATPSTMPGGAAHARAPETVKWIWDPQRNDHYYFRKHDQCYVYAKGALIRADTKLPEVIHSIPSQTNPVTPTAPLSDRKVFGKAPETATWKWDPQRTDYFWFRASDQSYVYSNGEIVKAESQLTYSDTNTGMKAGSEVSAAAAELKSSSAVLVQELTEDLQRHSLASDPETGSPSNSALPNYINKIGRSMSPNIGQAAFTELPNSDGPRDLQAVPNPLYVFQSSTQRSNSSSDETIRNQSNIPRTTLPHSNIHLAQPTLDSSGIVTRPTYMKRTQSYPSSQNYSRSFGTGLNLPGKNPR